MSEADTSHLLAAYSEGRMSAVELRQALGGVTFGDVLVALAKYGLPLPRASQAGREQRIELARTWLFPRGP